MSIRWFGGEGQQPGTREVPLETFVAALDRLTGSCDRLALVGTSFGADWERDTDPPEFRGLYEASLRADPGAAERAAIPVERIGGDVVLIAGGDDRVWPSTDFARRIADRRTAHAMETIVVTHPAAGRAAGPARHGDGPRRHTRGRPRAGLVGVAAPHRGAAAQRHPLTCTP